MFTFTPSSRSGSQPCGRSSADFQGVSIRKARSPPSAPSCCPPWLHWSRWSSASASSTLVATPAGRWCALPGRHVLPSTEDVERFTQVTAAQLRYAVLVELVVMDERRESGLSPVWFAGDVPDDGAMLVECDVVVEKYIHKPLPDAIGPLIALD